MKFDLFRSFFLQLHLASKFLSINIIYFCTIMCVMVISEWSCSKPARDVQAQVLHSKENRFHWQAFLLWYRSGGEVCVSVCITSTHKWPHNLITYTDWKHFWLVKLNTGITVFTITTIWLVDHKCCWLWQMSKSHVSKICCLQNVYFRTDTARVSCFVFLQ